MRTIKYRGKDVKTGEWKYGHLITLNVNDKTAYFIITDDYAVVDKELKPWEIAFFLNVDIFMVEPNTVGQFTGLLDKNGKEIYEDDIVKYNGSDWWYKVVFWNVGFKLNRPDGYFFTIERDDVFEVICNIHDNSELLRR